MPGSAGIALLFIIVGAVLVACGSGGISPGGSGSGSGGSAGTDAPTAPISVVTATNVWGDVVSQIGGQDVTVRPLVTDPAADPHSFEPSAQAQLAVSKAELIVQNGGGYDDWMTTLVDASGSTAPVINAVELSGSATATAAPSTAAAATEATSDSAGVVNEHVWYDLPTVALVGQQVAVELSGLRPEQAAYFQTNADVFVTKIKGLTSKVEAIKATHDGTGVAVTEPVPLYLTEAAGLVNKTPDAFSAAIEEGTDVPPTVLNDTLALFTGGQVAALIYNSQTASPETETVLDAAKQHNVAVVPVTETLPDNMDYLSWMDSTITALATALNR